MHLTPLVFNPTIGISSVLYFKEIPLLVITTTSSSLFLLTDINSSFSFSLNILIGFVYLVISKEFKIILLTIPYLVNAVI